MRGQQREPQLMPALKQRQQGTHLVPPRDHVAQHDHGLRANARSTSQMLGAPLLKRSPKDQRPFATAVSTTLKLEVLLGNRANNRIFGRKVVQREHAIRSKGAAITPLGSEASNSARLIFQH